MIQSSQYGRKSRRKITIPNPHTRLDIGSNDRIASQEAKEEPEIGKYVEGTIAEKDPNAVGEKAIRRAKGVIVGQNKQGDEWTIVDVGNPDRDVLGRPVSEPGYTPQKQILKDGTTIAPIPEQRRGHIQDLSERVRKVQQGQDQKIHP